MRFLQVHLHLFSLKRGSLLGLGLSLGLALGFGVALVGCTPDYPKCSKDAHCPGNKDGKEWCVDGLCQQCRPGEVGKNDCPGGKECKAGRCEAIAGYCTKDSDCPGKRCVNNRCLACSSDGDCQGGRCSEGRCTTETRTRCKSNDDCAESEDCINGFCTPAAGRKGGGGDLPACKLETIYFDYNESVLSAEGTSNIDRNAQCIKQAGRGVSLVGHTDPRGTDEYNLALSERRAQSVRDRLTRLGVSSDKLQTLPRGELDASGTDETGWSKDRRVDFQWR